MAKTTKRKYARSAGKDVKSEMHRNKRGTAKSGPGGKGGKVKSRKQAIAIGLSKARKEGKKVPRKKSGLTDRLCKCHWAGTFASRTSLILLASSLALTGF
jgi:uncharacterized protein DUF6496